MSNIRTKTKYVNTAIYSRKALIALTGIIAVTILSGCRINVRGRERPLVQVDDIKGSLELSYDKQTDDRKNQNIVTRSESTITEETLNLNAKGNVFDPKLMTFAAFVGLGLNQQKYDSLANSGSTDGNLTSYGIKGNFLPLKPYPFSLESSRSDSLIGRSFQSPLHVKNSTDGASLRLRIPEWPMTFTYHKSEIEQNSDLGLEENFFNRTSDKFSYTLFHDFNENSRMTFRSDISSLTQTSQQFINELDTQRHRLLHNLYFGDYRQHRLDTSLSYFNREDQFKSTTFEWNENLTLKHSDSFRTFYNTFLTENTVESIDNRTMTATVGFNHRLYDNFYTNFNTYISDSEFGANNTTRTVGGRLNFDYSRNNPWGKLFVNLSFEMSQQESSGQSGTSIVIDESHVFIDPLSFFLDNRDIDLSSILITDSTGTLIYTEGDDYTVSQVGDRVEISPTTLGTTFPNISDGQLLLIDYTYNVLGERNENYYGQYFKIQQDFLNGFSVYFTNRLYERDINSTINAIAADETTETTKYGIKYTRNRLTLLAERTNTESTFQSVETDRLAATTYWPLTPKTSLIGTVSQAWIDAVGQNSRQTEVFKAEGKLKTRVTRFMRVGLKSEYRDETSTDIGKTEGVRFGTFLDYNRALFSLKAEWNFYSLDRQNTSTDSTGFFVKAIRRF